MKILILNGPNLNMLGIRQPHIYGNQSYQDLVEMLEREAIHLGVDLLWYQSNHEGDLIDKIQEAYFQGVDGIIINAAAYTHTSIGIQDALKAVEIPTVEVHLSAIEKREDFRRHSYISPVALKVITGEGFGGYQRGLDFLVEYIQGR